MEILMLKIILIFKKKKSLTMAIPRLGKKLLNDISASG